MPKFKEIWMRSYSNGFIGGVFCYLLQIKIKKRKFEKGKKNKKQKRESRDYGRRKFFFFKKKKK